MKEPIAGRMRAELDRELEEDPGEQVDLDTAIAQIENAMRRALDEQRGLVVQVTVGVGKSRSTDKIAVERDAGGLISTPYIENSKEHKKRLGDLAVHRQGVRNFCLVPEITEPLQKVLSVSREFCPTCPHYKKACQAGKREDGRISVTQHQMMQDQQRLAEPLFADEMPNPMTIASITAEGIAAARKQIEVERASPNFPARYLDGVAEFTDLLDEILQSDVTNWDEILSRFGWTEKGSLRARAAKLLLLDSADSTPAAAGLLPGLGARMVKDAEFRERVAASAAAFRPLRMIARAIDEGLRLRRGDKGELWCASFTDEAIYTRKHTLARHDEPEVPADAGDALEMPPRLGGAVILDATPPVDELRVLFADRGAELEFLKIRVRDPEGVPIVRTIKFWSNGSRSRMGQHPDEVWSQIRWAAEFKSVGAKRSLLVIPRSIGFADTRQDFYRANKEKIAALWKEITGCKVVVSYYGSDQLKGSNRYEHYDAVITCGDPYPPKVEWERRGQELFWRLQSWEMLPKHADEDADLAACAAYVRRYTRQHVRDVLTQTHGRIRDCRRTAPAWHLHIGATAPGGWYTANTVVIPPSPRGNQPGTSEARPLVMQLKAKGMKLAEVARHLDVDRSQVSRWASGGKASGVHVTALRKLLAGLLVAPNT